MRDRVDKVVLGEGCVYSTDSNVTGINNNILVVGGSGSGKTVSIAEAFLLESYNRNIITTVTKRRIVKKYIPLLRDRGYSIWDLDFVHPENGNVGYDPLDFIKSYQDIVFVAKSIVDADKKKENSNADPYWNEAATSLFSSIIAYVLMKKPHPNFSDVLEMIDGLTFEEDGGEITTNYDFEFFKLEKANPSNFATVNWRSFRRLPIRTASCVFGVLNTATSFVFTPEFINMFYAHIFKELFEIGERRESGVLPRQVHMLADDFATGCPVPLFDQYISIFREKGISVTLLVQSESQLSSLYGDDKATTIINNCDTYVYMGSNDLETAKNIATRAGILTEECLNMKLGNQIIFRRGSKPIFSKRYNIFENKLYKSIPESFKDEDIRCVLNEERSSFIKELRASIGENEYDCFDENGIFKVTNNKNGTCEYVDSEYFKKYSDG